MTALDDILGALPAAEVAASNGFDASRGFFIDWPTFWAKDRRGADWLYEDVLARGRGHAIFAGHKVGKSLLTLAIVVQLIVRGIVVIYLDYEMGEDDLYDRLADMGYGPDTDLSRLHYALLPSLPPLDEPEGAKALFSKIDAVQALHPDQHVAVVIDTTGRAVAGEENSADTFRNFYRWTGLGLKQRGVTWARLDHAGKDAARGQRGSSGKGDDVDVVWKLGRTEHGLELRRTASRMGWVPEKVAFRLEQNPHLRFVKVAEDWPAGTKAVVDWLDELGVEASAGERPAGKALREAHKKAGQYLIRAAQRYRRERDQGSGSGPAAGNNRCLRYKCTLPSVAPPAPHGWQLCQSHVAEVVEDVEAFGLDINDGYMSRCSRCGSRAANVPSGFVCPCERGWK